MGRVGTGAYDTLHQKYGDQVVGIDVDLDVVTKHKNNGRNILHADPTTDEFWRRCERREIHMILLALPELEQNLRVTEGIRSCTSIKHISALVKFPEEIEKLKDAGVDVTWNLYAEAGSGYAEEVIATLGNSSIKESEYLKG